MLKVNYVTKKYGKVMANKDLNFEVAEGQIAILLGPNGAGKSTIIKCIVGLLRFEGEILIKGHQNKSLEAKKILGYIPEMPCLYPLLTVEEHLEFIAKAYQLTNWEPYAEELLKRFELEDKRKKLGGELSKGMQQKVSICCGILHKPKVIVFDEPLVGLDPHAIKELKALLKELKAQGAALLISTHMIDSVEDYWDVAHIMQQGSFAATKTKMAMDEEEQSLENLFFSIIEGEGGY